MKQLRSVKSLLLPLLICAGCIAYLASDFELSRFWDSWRGFDSIYLATALLLGGLSILALGSRLRFLAGNTITFATACKAALVSLSLNLLLPAKLGEVGKIAFLAERGCGTVAKATHLVFWERFLDLHMLLAVALLAIWMGLPAAFSIGVTLIIVGLWLGLAIVRTRTQLVLSLLRHIPLLPLQDFLRQLIVQLGDGVGARRLIGGGVLTLAPWGIYACQIVFVLLFSMGFDLSPVQLLGVFLVASISSSVPLTPGAIGVYEAAIVVVLSQFQIEKELALSAAIMMHTMQFLPVLFAAACAVVLAPEFVKTGIRRSR